MPTSVRWCLRNCTFVWVSVSTVGSITWAICSVQSLPPCITGWVGCLPCSKSVTPTSRHLPDIKTLAFKAPPHKGSTFAGLPRLQTHFSRLDQYALRLCTKSPLDRPPALLKHPPYIAQSLSPEICHLDQQVLPLPRKQQIVRL